MKKTGLKLLTAMMALAGAMVVPVFAGDTTTLTLIHTNDIHGNVSDNGKSTIGFAKFATYVDELRENENVLVVDAGDMFQGLPYANLTNGQSVVPLANAIGYDMMTVGNHEFDFGSANLFNLVSKLNFPVLSANIQDDATGKNAFESYIVKEVDGVKVGIFGMTTEETAFKSHPDNTKGYTFTDMISASADVVKTLKEDEKVDVVIMVGHLGLDEGDYTSDLVAEAVKGIDVIVDGHSHTELPEGRKVADTLIVSTGTAFNNVGRVELTVTDGEVEDVKASLLGYDAFAEVTPNAEIEAEIERITAEQQASLSEVVGTATVDLEGTRGIVRTGESNLGQLATAAMQKLTGADVVLTNGGGIRASIPAGDITLNHLVTVFPFGNTVMVKEIKGSDLLAALEHGTSEYPNEKGAFPHTAGLTFTLNAYKTADRVSDVKVNGEDLDLNKTYSIALPDFVAAGGDDYTMFAAYPVKAEYNTLMDTLVDYVKELGTVDGSFEERITILTEAPAVEAPVVEAPVVETPAVEVTETVKNEVVALRSYLQSKDYKVVFNNEAKQVVVTKGDVEVTLTVGEKAYTAKDADSNVTGTLTSALTMKNNVTMMNTADLEAILAKLAA